MQYESDRENTFVGLDAHFEHCVMKAVDYAGKTLLEADVPTTLRSLRRPLRRLPGPVWVLMESSTMALFVKQCIEGVVDRVIVCETRENRWIAKSDQKGDAADADRLARLLRMGEFKEVHVPSKGRQEIRELVLAYQKAVGDLVRAKCRIRAGYRRHGIPAAGESVYDSQERKHWLERLKRANPRAVMDAQYAMLDAAQGVQEGLSRRLSGRR